MRDDIGPDFESGGDARDHFAEGHFVGCGNCGFAVDVTVPVLQHVDLLLSMLHDLLEHATPEELREAIALTRGTMDETMRSKAVDAHAHHGFGVLHKKHIQRLRERSREAPKRRVRRRRS